MDRITNRPARSGPTKLAFHASRIIIDVGVLISMAAMSMPFVTTEGADRSSVAADALPVILLLAPIFLITMIPDHTRPIPMPLGWASLVLGIAAFPYAIVKYLDAANLAKTLGGNVGFGARLLIFGTFVTLAGIGVSLARNLLHLPSGGTYPARRPKPQQSGPEPAPRRPTQRQGTVPEKSAQAPAQRARPATGQATRQPPVPRPNPERPTDGRGNGPRER